MKWQNNDHENWKKKIKRRIPFVEFGYTFEEHNYKHLESL